LIAIDACGFQPSLRAVPQSFGHSVKLIAPQLVKPYVKRNKNDTADPEALCEAMSRPTMRFVPVKTAEQRTALMLVGVRDRMIRNRTQLSNAIHGHAAEFDLTAARGWLTWFRYSTASRPMRVWPCWLEGCLSSRPRVRKPRARIGEIDAGLTTWHKADECSQCLDKIPGVGPIGAVPLRMKTSEPELFQSRRQFAAWIGLTPKDHSTTGKVRLDVITRAGDEGLRSVLVAGATAAIQHAQRGGKASPWPVELLRRKSPKLAAMALANKTASPGR
jgi:transposase